MIGVGSAARRGVRWAFSEYLAEIASLSLGFLAMTSFLDAEIAHWLIVHAIEQRSSTGNNVGDLAWRKRRTAGDIDGATAVHDHGLSPDFHVHRLCERNSIGHVTFSSAALRDSVVVALTTSSSTSLALAALVYVYFHLTTASADRLLARFRREIVA